MYVYIHNASIVIYKKTMSLQSPLANQSAEIRLDRMNLKLDMYFFTTKLQTKTQLNKENTPKKFLNPRDITLLHVNQPGQNLKVIFKLPLYNYKPRSSQYL